MNTEQFITLADTLRTRALGAGTDINASNFRVHAALLRALRSHTLDQIAADTLARDFDADTVKPE